jgi:hypothetical protein
MTTCGDTPRRRAPDALPCPTRVMYLSPVHVPVRDNPIEQYADLSSVPTSEPPCWVHLTWDGGPQTVDGDLWGAAASPHPTNRQTDRVSAAALHGMFPPGCPDMTRPGWAV